MLDLFDRLKDFLYDRPVYAFLTVSMVVNAYLFRLLLKEKDARLAMAERWLFIAGQMNQLVNKAALKARTAKNPPPNGDSDASV